MTRLTSALVASGVATLHEVMGRRNLLDGIHLLVGPSFAGQAMTVETPAGDNLGVHMALADAGEGAVLCIATQSRARYGVIGELILEAARARGLAGIVVEDAVRDIERLAPPPSIAALGVSARGTVKRRVCSLGSPIGLAGALIRPGDWIVGDSDGVCVVAVDEVEGTLHRARARLDREEALAPMLREGASTLEVFNLPVPTNGAD